MAALNLILALMAVAGVAAVALLGFFAAREPDHVLLHTEGMEQDHELELAA
jgi:hypothetical protein